MKKIRSILFVLMLLTVSSMAFSQAEFAIGIKGGPNFANIDTEATAGKNYNNRTGFHGGAFALLKFTKVGIQPEVLFSQQGSTVKYPSGGKGDIEYNYVNIPVMLKLYTIAGINIQAGPQFGFLTKAVEETVIGNVKTTEDVKSKLKGSEVSLGLGLGWDFPFGLTLDARYNLGLSKMNDTNGSKQLKNQVFQASIGFKLFRFGK